MKKLFFSFLLIMGISLGLVSCLDSNGGNYQTFPTAPVVVNYDVAKGGTTMLTCWGEITAPELSKFDAGDCLLAQFSIDYDKQPSPDYYTATVLNYVQINVGETNVENEIAVGDFTLPIEDVLTSSYNNTLLLKGKYFLSIEHEIPNDQLVEYKLIAGRDSVDEKTGAYGVYLLAKKGNESTAKPIQTINNQAFDVNQMINTLGKDTTINSIRMKLVKVNLKYYSGETEGQPEFKNYNTTPIEMAIYN
jgi:hypothetical protein